MFKFFCLLYFCFIPLFHHETCFAQDKNTGKLSSIRLRMEGWSGSQDYIFIPGKCIVQHMNRREVSLGIDRVVVSKSIVSDIFNSLSEWDKLQNLVNLNSLYSLPDNVTAPVEDIISDSTYNIVDFVFTDSETKSIKCESDNSILKENQALYEELLRQKIGYCKDEG